MIQLLLLIFSAIIIFEFGIHVIYHALTGKAGLNDQPFAYLKDIFRQINRGG